MALIYFRNLFKDRKSLNKFYKILREFEPEEGNLLKNVCEIKEISPVLFEEFKTKNKTTFMYSIRHAKINIVLMKTLQDLVKMIKFIKR